MPARFNPMKIFSGSSNRALAEEIAHHLGVPLGRLTLQRFSDGEIQPVIEESVRGCDVFFVQSTISPADHLMELLLMIDAARRASAHYITAVIPYYGYARQDRKDKPRVPIGARLVADMLTVAGAHRVITVDLHAGQIQGFFNIPLDHLEARVIFIPYIRSLRLEPLVLAAPDMGSSGRVREYAKALHAEMVICDKHRKRANEVEEMRLIGDVEGRHVILIDDMIDTAGTLVAASELIKAQGALSVRAMATHAVLSGPAYERLQASVLEEVVVTNTIPLRRSAPKIKTLSVGRLLADAIQSVYEHHSISALLRVQ